MSVMLPGAFTALLGRLEMWFLGLLIVSIPFRCACHQDYSFSHMRQNSQEAPPSQGISGHPTRMIAFFYFHSCVSLYYCPLWLLSPADTVSKEGRFRGPLPSLSGQRPAPA